MTERPWYKVEAMFFILPWVAAYKNLDKGNAWSRKSVSRHRKFKCLLSKTILRTSYVHGNMRQIEGALWLSHCILHCRLISINIQNSINCVQSAEEGSTYEHHLSCQDERTLLIVFTADRKTNRGAKRMRSWNRIKDRHSGSLGGRSLWSLLTQVRAVRPD